MLSISKATGHKGLSMLKTKAQLIGLIKIILYLLICMKIIDICIYLYIIARVLWYVMRGFAHVFIFCENDKP